MPKNRVSQDCPGLRAFPLSPHDSMQTSPSRLDYRSGVSQVWLRFCVSEDVSCSIVNALKIGFSGAAARSLRSAASRNREVFALLNFPSELWARRVT